MEEKRREEERKRKEEKRREEERRKWSSQGDSGALNIDGEAVTVEL